MSKIWLKNVPIFLAEGIPAVGMAPFAGGWSTTERNVRCSKHLAYFVYSARGYRFDLLQKLSSACYKISFWVLCLR